MKLIWSENAWDDYLYWQSNDKKMVTRINDRIWEIKRTPYTGTGKPEPLRHNWTEYWSRRISLTDRLVYKHTESAIYIAQTRYH
ncbi:Txe/YoeB family addiction module toxin [Thalassospira mesophila]|uniref:Putative mRNA interferase YoeB n=1 Tax=Thalassospira mesophila TaxID=1293891 RepID=A0A1Y2KZV8_9PROT|nr:Txe/YoeB family addiction module toxin [Thalassospira mesophila]OSQ38396.1 toxin YoeB [Thalassospira mesophila]